MSPPPPPTLDPERIRRAIFEHDPTAFAELYRAYDPHVRGAVAAWLRKVPRLLPYAEEIQSDVWVRLLAHERRLLRRYDPTRGSFRGFIRLVAIGTAFRAAESRRLLPRLWSDEIDVDQLEREGGSELEAWILDEDFLRKLHALVERRCTSDDHVVLVEMGLRGRSGKEVGAMIGKSESAVFTRLCRLRRDVLPQLVKELLAEHGHDDPGKLTASCLLATFLALAHHELEPGASAATSSLAADGG